MVNQLGEMRPMSPWQLTWQFAESFIAFKIKHIVNGITTKGIQVL